MRRALIFASDANLIGTQGYLISLAIPFFFTESGKRYHAQMPTRR